MLILGVSCPHFLKTSKPFKPIDKKKTPFRFRRHQNKYFWWKVPNWKFDCKISKRNIYEEFLKQEKVKIINSKAFSCTGLVEESPERTILIPELFQLPILLIYIIRYQIIKLHAEWLTCF